MANIGFVYIHIRKADQTAQRRVFFDQSHGVSKVVGVNRRGHSGGAAANNQHLLRCRSPGELRKTLFHTAVRVDGAGGTIHDRHFSVGAGLHKRRRRTVLHRSREAVEAAEAFVDLFGFSGGGLICKGGVGKHLSAKGDKVCFSGSDDLLAHGGIIESANHNHGNADRFLDDFSLGNIAAVRMEQR